MDLLRENNKIPREFQEISDYVESPDLEWDFEIDSAKSDGLEFIKWKISEAKRIYNDNANRFVWKMALTALASIAVVGTLRINSYFDVKKQFKLSDLGRQYEFANTSKDAVDEFRNFAEDYRKMDYVISLSELQNKFYVKKGIDASVFLNLSEKEDLMNRKELTSLINEAEKKYDAQILKVEQSYHYKANKRAGKMAQRDGLLFYLLALTSIITAFKCRTDVNEKADEISKGIYDKLMTRLNVNNKSYKSYS